MRRVGLRGSAVLPSATIRAFALTGAYLSSSAEETLGIARGIGNPF
jgi:hypothetical protein